MRLEFETLSKIKETFGDFEVGNCFITKDGRTESFTTLRFGYWERVDVTKLNSLLPFNHFAKLDLVDEDEDCGLLFQYIIK